MKKLFVIAAAMLAAISAGAQNYVNLGYGLPTSITRYSNEKSNGIDGNAFTLGYSHNFDFTDFMGLEMGVNGVYEFFNTKDDLDKTLLETRSNYLGATAPVLLNFKLDMDSVAFKFLAGATCSYGFVDKMATFVDGVKGFEINNYDDLDARRFGVSASAALAAEWADVFRFKIGFDYGLTDLNKNSNIKNTVNMLSFSVGYLF